MLFTTGNLITLGIVAVVLVLFRQLDKENRSLEKVKKYADKLRDDLDAYVDKRAEDLKRFGIELDVQQKAAKEVLKRLQTVEEGLSAKAESIGGIEKRIGEYDSALARLMQMTARVDENLARIQEESEFTEQVAKKIEGAQRSLSAIERELPTVREGFVRDNRADLEAFKEGLLAETGTRIVEIENRLERASAEAEQSLERAETAKREADREFQLAFERARIEAEKLEDAAFERLKAASDMKAGRLKETIEEKFAQIGQTAKDKAAEAQALLKTFKAEWKAEAEDLLAATRAEIGRAAEELGSKLDATATKSAAIEAEAERRFSAVEKHSEELARGLEAKARELLAESETRHASLEAEAERRFASVEKQGEELAHNLAEKAHALLTAQKEAFEAKATEYRAQAQAFIDSGRAAVAKAEAELGARLEATATKSASLEAEAERRFSTAEKQGEELAQSLAEKATALLAAQKEAFEAKAAEYSAQAQAFIDSGRAAVAKAEAELGSRLEAASATSASLEAEAERRFAVVEKRGDELARSLEEKARELLAASETRSASIEADTARRFSAVEKRSEELAQGLAEKARALLAAQKEAFEAKAAEAKAEVAAQLAELDRSVAAAREGAAEAGKELASVIDIARSAAATVAEKVAREGEEAALNALGGVEARLGEYGSELEGKFARLEAVNADIASLEAALRASMAESERRIQGDFQSFGQALEEKRKRFEEAFAAESEGIRKGMESLEEDLAALKSRAYDNVSEKLKGFEDEFFADLKARSEASEARLEAWKAELDRGLEEMGARARAERSEVEKTGLEELRARIAETQSRAFEQLETVRQRVDGIQDGIRAQAETAEEALLGLKEALRHDAVETRKSAQTHLEGELARFSAEAESKLKAAERKSEEGLAALAAGIVAEETRLAEMRATAARAAEEFRSSFGHNLAAAEEKVKKELEAWQKGTKSLLDSLSTDYETQRDSYMSQAREERERLQKELSGLADRTAELRQDLGSRISQALEGFSRGYESLLGDLGKRQREAQAETEAKLREFQSAAQELALKIEAGKAQALGKVETEAQRLGQVLAEIDKEQKSFIAQTKIFERADQLAAGLSASIETMKVDIGRLDSRKAEIAEIENQLSRVKRLEDEVNQKVTRFLAEKRRIDALEEDFGRLAGVAQGVDQKLAELTGQSDALTEAQARIRKLLELSAEAETKYERLEKKTQILDATAEAVDKNFQGVQGIEKLLAGIGAEARRLPERILEIKRSVDELEAGKERTEEAARKLGELDAIIGDAEKRIVEAQKAREWLARAETRLEEVNRQAQEQLKLLSTLLKEEGVDKKGKGAPPSSVQETVRKLARQGWSADEIARAVKVSRGEVELILELGGKA